MLFCGATTLFHLTCEHLSGAIDIASEQALSNDMISVQQSSLNCSTHNNTLHDTIEIKPTIISAEVPSQSTLTFDEIMGATLNQVILYIYSCIKNIVIEI